MLIAILDTFKLICSFYYNAQLSIGILIKSPQLIILSSVPFIIKLKLYPRYS